MEQDQCAPLIPKGTDDTIDKILEFKILPSLPLQMSINVYMSVTWNKS
jgi:hypothetical protein